MTILEQQIYNTLLAIEAEKSRRDWVPCSTLLRGDKLIERVEERMGMPVRASELYAALHALHLEGYIMMGDTINDEWVQVKYKNFTSKL